jgi:hypothetical protein
LIQVYLKQGNLDEALKAAQKAVDLAEEAQKPFFKNRLATIEKQKAGK